MCHHTLRATGALLTLQACATSGWRAEARTRARAARAAAAAMLTHAEHPIVLLAGALAMRDLMKAHAAALLELCEEHGRYLEASAAALRCALRLRSLPLATLAATLPRLLPIGAGKESEPEGADAARARAVACGLPGLLTRVLTNFPDDADACSAVCDALFNLCFAQADDQSHLYSHSQIRVVPTCWDAARAAGLVRATVALLRAPCAADGNAAVSAVCMLKAVAALGDAMAAELVAAGALPAVVATMRRHETRSLLLRVACGFFAYACQRTEHCAAAAAAGAVEPLVALLARGVAELCSDEPERVSLAQLQATGVFHALAALSVLVCDKGAAGRAAEAGAMPHALRALHLVVDLPASGGAAQLFPSAASLVSDLCVTAAAVSATAESGAARAICSYARAHMAEASVFTHHCCALIRMMNARGTALGLPLDDAAARMRAAIGAQGGVELALAALRAHGRNLDASREATRLLHCLCNGCPQHSQRAAADGAVPLVAALLATHAEDLRTAVVALQLTWFILDAAPREADAAIVSSSIAAGAARAIAAHMQDDATLQATCGVLALLAKHSPAGRAAVARTEALEACAEALRLPRFAGDDDAAAQIANCVWSLVYAVVVPSQRCAARAARAQLLPAALRDLRKPSVPRSLKVMLREIVDAVDAAPVTETSAPAACGLPGCGAARRADGSGKPLLRCSRCRTVCYCGAEHQRADWPRHKEECAPPTQRNEAGAADASS